jgi:transcriptional regulator with XRE-family HTH domain
MITNTKVKNQKRVDIVVGSKRIKEAIKIRRQQLDLTYEDIIRHAKEAGIKGLTKSNLSLYFNNDKPVLGFPTQRHIIFMCIRYGISIGLNINYIDVEKTELINGKYSEHAKQYAKETE